MNRSDSVGQRIAENNNSEISGIPQIQAVLLVSAAICLIYGWSIEQRIVLIVFDTDCYEDVVVTAVPLWETRIQRWNLTVSIFHFKNTASPAIPHCAGKYLYHSLVRRFIKTKTEHTW